MRILVVVLALAFSFSTDAQVRRRAVRPGTAPPAPCVVTGLTGMFRSEDGGKTFSSNASTAPIDFLFDLQFLDDPPQTAIAASLNAVYDSLDGGCSWTLRHTITKDLHHPVHISRAANGRAFLWSDEIFLRYDQSTVQELSPPVAIGALAVDHADNQHVRMFGLLSGAMWISRDGGVTWTNSGRGLGTTVRDVAQNPADFDHLLVITNAGAQLSRDGGVTWTSATGLTRTVCRLGFVRNMPNVVWSSLTIRAGSDTIFRSENGGSGFQPVGEVSVTSDAEGACLPLVVHPSDPNVAVVPFRELYSIDATTRSVGASNCCGNILRTAWSLADPNVVLMSASPR